MSKAMRLVLSMLCALSLQLCAADCVNGDLNACSGNGVCLWDRASQRDKCFCSGGYGHESNDFDCPSHVLTLRIVSAFCAAIALFATSAVSKRILDMGHHVRHKQLQSTGTTSLTAVLRELAAHKPLFILALTGLSPLANTLYNLARAIGDERIGRNIFATWCERSFGTPVIDSPLCCCCSGWCRSA
jgi:hypothetical protein